MSCHLADHTLKSEEVYIKPSGYLSGPCFIDGKIYNHLLSCCSPLKEEKKYIVNVFCRKQFSEAPRYWISIFSQRKTNTIPNTSSNKKHVSWKSRRNVSSICVICSGFKSYITLTEGFTELVLLLYGSYDGSIYLPPDLFMKQGWRRLFKCCGVTEENSWNTFVFKLSFIYRMLSWTCVYVFYHAWPHL